jgi:FtsP/CotA-like multicopper oxidase with cupredoxin domain
MPETGAHVKPKDQYTYHWEVPERAGPGPEDPDSVVWLYHGHDHEGVDIYAGLVGAIIITRSGSAKPDGAPKDVDREFVTLFMIFDENMSVVKDPVRVDADRKPSVVAEHDGDRVADLGVDDRSQDPETILRWAPWLERDEGSVGVFADR